MKKFFLIFFLIFASFVARADYLPPNSCVLTAIKAELYLPQNIEKKILVVEFLYKGHAMLIFKYKGELYAYDEDGTIKLKTKDWNASVIAREIFSWYGKAFFY